MRKPKTNMLKNIKDSNIKVLINEEDVMKYMYDERKQKLF